MADVLAWIILFVSVVGMTGWYGWAMMDSPIGALYAWAAVLGVCAVIWAAVEVTT